MNGSCDAKRLNSRALYRAILNISLTPTEKFGGDSLGEMRRNFDAYAEQMKQY